MENPKCFICQKPIIPPDNPVIIKGISFHEKCYSDLNETYRKSKVLQKLVKFAFRGKFPGVD